MHEAYAAYRGTLKAQIRARAIAYDVNSPLSSDILAVDPETPAFFRKAPIFRQIELIRTFRSDRERPDRKLPDIEPPFGIDQERGLHAFPKRRVGGRIRDTASYAPKLEEPPLP